MATQKYQDYYGHSVTVKNILTDPNLLSTRRMFDACTYYYLIVERSSDTVNEFSMKNLTKVFASGANDLLEILYRDDRVYKGLVMSDLFRFRYGSKLNIDDNTMD